ncbi:hypothetical protein ACJQ40_001931 [Enterococcus faecium]|nr:hypothetical protein [Enterococcus faecium]
MARPVLEAMDMYSLTKGKYIDLLAKGYSAKDVFKALSKGSNMEKETLRKEFDFWRELNGIKEMKPVRPLIKKKKSKQITQ